jgi:phage protein D
MAAAASVQFVPDYSLDINGEKVPAALKSSIAGITFDSGLNAADRVEIAIANPGLEWLQSHISGLGFQPFPTNVRLGPFQTPNLNGAGLFDMGNKVELSLGYTDQPLTHVFKGEITGIEVSLTAGGMPMMTIVAHNYLNRLNTGSYARGFGPLPDVVIAAILSAENLLRPKIDPSVLAASAALTVVNIVFNGAGRKQKAQTDLQLLKEIAKTYDADFWVEDSTLYLARFFKEYSASVTLAWGESLIEFTPKISTVGSVFGVGAKFTLREIPLSFTVTLSWNLDTESLAINVIPGTKTSKVFLKNLVGPIITLINRPISSPADIVNSALVLARKLRSKVNNRLTATATAVGDPALLANKVVKFNGVGPDFSGNYRITNAHHVIDSNGYHTKFHVRKEILP